VSAPRTPFSSVLTALARHRGVAGSMVVGEADGILVDSTLRIGVRGDAVAALAASLYRKARRSSHAAGFGDVAFLQLEAERGRLCVAGRGGLVLVAVAEREANVGLLRADMRRALEALA
jgi:predicted regulator of Ras-like GTPase activity (Roadblock/LC7/MglB family)